MPSEPRWRGGSLRRRGSERAPLSRRFTYRYVLAVVLVGIIALVAKASVDHSLNAIELNATRQAWADSQPTRVYSINDLTQRLTNVAPGTPTGETDKWSNELFAEANRLQQIQVGLLKGDASLGIPEAPIDPRITDLYERNLLNQRVESIATSATAIAALRSNTEQNIADRVAQKLVIEQNSPEAINQLDQAVDLYNDEAKALVREQETTNQTLLVVCIIAAALMVLALFRPMARQIHQETSQLEQAEQMHRENNERQTFRNELSQALEVTNSEDEVLAAVARALTSIVPENKVELLLGDSSRAHLRRSQVSPTAGAPGCPVDSPLNCAAIRRGQTQVYKSSRMLNVCPKLPEHAAGSCSAVCVPVMFLGNALGVLHATGPDGEPPEGTEIERLSVLAAETGQRLGTLRATQVTEMQASTDGLTGLLNRRMLEVQARALLLDGKQFSVAMADLDHFKTLNDTHGHEAGDRALRLFAGVLRANLRPDDVAARYGGEEFVIVLPGTILAEALPALERLQQALEHELKRTGAIPFTASWGLTDSTAGTSFDEVIAVADAALYSAKRAGRNCIMVDGEAAAASGLAAPDEAEPSVGDRMTGSDHSPTHGPDRDDREVTPQRPVRAPVAELRFDEEPTTEAHPSPR